MRLLVELSGESEELARAEIEAVARSEGSFFKIMESDGRAFVIESDADPTTLGRRAALAWSVSEHRFSCALGDVGSETSQMTLPGKTFRINVRKLGEDRQPGMSKHLIGEMAGALSSTNKVDLESPDTEIRVLVADRCHAGLLIHEIERSAFESRKPENRPFSHPISLHPRLARALVNLTGAKEGDRILDPFCGTGGIVIEAALMGLKPVGSDIDERMLQGTEKNMAHFRLDEAELHLADISEIGNLTGKVKAIATDPPYGRSASTAREPVESLYERAFEAFAGILEPEGRLAIVLPSEENVKLASDRFRLLGRYPVRVHRSLTRHVCLFRPI